MNPLLRRLLSTPAIAHLPTRVRGGVADGARWSFFPWTAYWRGTHEPEVQNLLLGLGDWTGKHVWDLGSHYGIFAIGLGRRVGPTGSVAAFEPNPLSFARLQLHLRRNPLPWVSLFPCAVSDTESEERFFLYKGLDTTSCHLAYENETWDPSIQTIQVRTVRIDDLVAAGKMRAPDFIKLDVEGHGHRALAGAARTLATSRPRVLAGMHSEAECAGIRAILGPDRYDCRPVLAAAPPEPAVGYDYLFTPRGA